MRGIVIIIPKSRETRLAVAGIVVGAITLVTFWPVLGARAILFDDYEYVIQNPLVQHPSWRSAWLFLSEVRSPSTVSGYYQPLAMTSLMIDYALGRGDYQVFHAVSLGLHVGCTILVIGLVYALFGDIWAAAAAGLLFGLHPGAVESMAWVSDRKTLVATFFALGSLILYVRHARRPAAGNYSACLLLFGLALLSKPTVTLLPVVLMLMDFWPLRRWGRRSILEKLPLLGLAGISAAITSISQGAAGGVITPEQYPIWGTPLILAHNIIFYLRNILWPAHLSAYYPWPKPFNLSQPAVQIGLIGTLLLLPILIASIRWTRALLVSWLMFFVIILPAIGIIGFTTSIAADRFAYLPKIGLLIGLAYFIHRVNQSNKHRQWFVAAAVLCASVAEIRWTREYLQEWGNSERLLRYMVAQSPKSPYLHGNLGNVLQGEGKIEDAAREYLAALALGEDVAAHQGLGEILRSQGNLIEAERHLRAAHNLLPQDVGTAVNFAIVLDRLHKFDESSAIFEQVVRARPHMASVFFDYGLSLFRQGRLDAAEQTLRRALELQADHGGAHYQLGCLLASRGQFREALDHWRLAAGANPSDAQTLVTLAWVLATADDASLRNGRKAVELAQKADELAKGADPSILDTLAAAFAEDGRFDDAAAAARASIERWKAIGKPEAVGEVEARLQLFLNKRPFHEAPRRESYLAQ